GGEHRLGRGPWRHFPSAMSAQGVAKLELDRIRLPDRLWNMLAVRTRRRLAMSFEERLGEGMHEFCPGANAGRIGYEAVPTCASDDDASAFHIAENRHRMAAGRGAAF